MASTPCPHCNKAKRSDGGWLSSRTFYAEGRRVVEIYCWQCGYTEKVQ